MKTVRKSLILAACAIMLVCATIAGTLAYLTATASVKNTFTVGNVAITMDETDVDNSTPDEDRDTENKYKLLPGQTYTKDPIIHVSATSEDCYVFVKVTNNISAVEAAGDSTIAEQLKANGWNTVPNESNVYYKEDAVKANADVDVFGSFTVSDSATNEQLKAIDGKTIEVEAYAVQATFDTAVEAWNATFGAEQA